MTSLGAPKVIDYRARKTRRVIRCQKRAASARDRASRPLTLLHVCLRENVFMLSPIKDRVSSELGEVSLRMSRVADESFGFEFTQTWSRYLLPDNSWSEISFEKIELQSSHWNLSNSHSWRVNLNWIRETSRKQSEFIHPDRRVNIFTRNWRVNVSGVSHCQRNTFILQSTETFAHMEPISSFDLHSKKWYIKN